MDKKFTGKQLHDCMKANNCNVEKAKQLLQKQQELEKQQANEAS